MSRGFWKHATGRRQGRPHPRRGFIWSKSITRSQEFCGDSRLRLSGPRERPSLPPSTEIPAEITDISSKKELLSWAAAQSRTVALRATDSRRRLSPHNLCSAIFREGGSRQET